MMLEISEYSAHPNEDMQDYSVCLESERNDDYDSDCSLGSMNSLHLSLNENVKCPNFNHTNSVDKKPIQKDDLHKTVKIQNSAQKMLCSTVDNRNISKMLKKNSIDFYGKVIANKSILQHRYSKIKLNKIQKLNKEYKKLKTFKPQWSIRKLKQNNFNKSHILSKNQKHRKRVLNQRNLNKQTKLQRKKNLIRNQSKKSIPFLLYNCKVFEKNGQNNEKYFIPENNKKILQNKIKRDCGTTNQMENQYLDYHDNIGNLKIKSEYFDDFMDTDDEGENFNLQIEDIINNLSHEDDYFGVDTDQQ